MYINPMLPPPGPYGGGGPDVVKCFKYHSKQI